MQSDMYHLRIPADVSKIIKEQAARCDVSANHLAAKLLKAAAEAIKDARGSILPPHFEFLSEAPGEFRAASYRLSETHKKK